MTYAMPLEMQGDALDDLWTVYVIFLILGSKVVISACTFTLMIKPYTQVV